MKITSFKDLVAWQEGHKLVILIYGLTKVFPIEEKYCLIDQMRRCVISITSNIAEGFSRKGKREKSQFYYMALGSLTELENQMLISYDLKYINKVKFDEISAKIVSVNKLLHGLIKSVSLYT